jgi:hypothetical protein
MTPIEVEVIFPLITAMEFSCRRCHVVMDQMDVVRKYHEACREEYPEDWKKCAEDLHEWIRRAKELYKHRIRIALIDAQSPLGLWRQIRHRVFKMPAFVVDGKRVHSGWDTERLEALIDEQIREAANRMDGSVSAAGQNSL